MNQAYGSPYNPALAQRTPAAPKRNVALILASVFLFALALGAGAVFLINLSQYLTIEERWANDPLLSPAARDFGVSIIQHAAMKRMTLFGPISGGLGVVGLVLFVLGLRKR